MYNFSSIKLIYLYKNEGKITNLVPEAYKKLYFLPNIREVNELRQFGFDINLLLD